MAHNNRPQNTLKPQNKLTPKVKFVVGAGIITSLIFAISLAYSSQANFYNPELDKVAVVRVATVESPAAGPGEGNATSKKIADIEAKWESLRLAKEETYNAEKIALNQQLVLLRSIEDVEMKLALHQEDPNFDPHALQEQLRLLEEELHELKTRTE